MEKGEVGEVEQDDVEAKGGGEGGWVGGLMALEATELLTRDADPGVTTLVDSRNGFNELIRLAMLWTVHHFWPEGSRFAINCYRHWAQILLRQPGDAPVILLRREGATHGDLLSMVLYAITLAPLVEEIKDEYPTLLSPF